MSIKKFVSLLMILAIITLGAFAPALVANASGDAFEPVWVDSLTVHANGTEGRTAVKAYTINAGPDRVFIPDTIKFAESSRSGGGRIEVKFIDFKYRDVTVTFNGNTYKQRLPYEFTVVASAGTGSGFDNYNRGAWVNGYMMAETVNIK